MTKESGETEHLMFDDGKESVRNLKEQGINAHHFGTEVRSYNGVIRKVKNLSRKER